MLRHHVQRDAKAAQAYYTLADYLAEGEELKPEFGGLGARRLGLEGSGSKQAFDRLCDNLHPETGEKLTIRRKDNRIVGIDFTFDGPKSFAILEALTDDPRLRDALRQSALETMREMEQAVSTRVRRNGADQNRTVGEMIWFEAPHDTSRPVDGVPDMQPHHHFFVLNAVFDPAEQRWKAANLFDVLRDLPYYQAAFHQRLANRLQDLGYAIERKGNFFELAGVSRKTIDLFSRRTRQIEEEAREQGITDPHQKSELGARTREHKGKNFSRDALRRLWVSRLTKPEFESLVQVHEQAKEREGGGQHRRSISVTEAMEHAAAHVFERKSSAPTRELMAHALAYGVGSFSVEDAWAEVEKGDRFTADVDGRRFVASRAVLAEERELIRLARDGRVTLPPINPAWSIQNTQLNVAQRAAVHRLLSSEDFVTMVVGDAGVGKTTLLKEARAGAEAAGRQVFAFAPSASASRVNLRKEGFAEADTIARLLVDKELQEQVRGQVLLIDEAALLGTKETVTALRLAKELKARVWIVGDDKQHGSVTRGAPFELLQTKAGIRPARVDKILRQQGEYKKAVELARDTPELAIERLSEMGWVREVPDAERYQLLAGDYLQAVAAGDKEKAPTALVIAPTHVEGNRVTSAIRAGLKAQGKLKDEHEFLQLTSKHLTEAERRDPHNLESGDVLQFIQNAPGYRRGQRVAVAEGAAPPVQHANRFQAYRAGTIRFSAGDRVRVTSNGNTRDGHRLNNGELLTVTGFTKAGDIVDHRGWVIPKDYGHLAHGYVVTSVSSQSRTVDRVLVAMGAESRGAINREQLYVSLSRGREWARVYTDDAKALSRAVKKSDERVSATELARLRTTQKRPTLLHRLLRQQRRDIERDRSRAMDNTNTHHVERSAGYER